MRTLARRLHSTLAIRGGVHSRNAYFRVPSQTPPCSPHPHRSTPRLMCSAPRLMYLDVQPATCAGACVSRPRPSLKPSPESSCTRDTLRRRRPFWPSRSRAEGFARPWARFLPHHTFALPADPICTFAGRSRVRLDSSRTREREREREREFSPGKAPNRQTSDWRNHRIPRASNTHEGHRRRSAEPWRGSSGRSSDCAACR